LNIEKAENRIVQVDGTNGMDIQSLYCFVGHTICKDIGRYRPVGPYPIIFKYLMEICDYEPSLLNEC
jgi:hypothetical protein